MEETVTECKLLEDDVPGEEGKDVPAPSQQKQFLALLVRDAAKLGSLQVPLSGGPLQRRQQE